MTSRVGFGRAVITPPLPVALAGFGDRAGPATEIRDDLEVRAFYTSADGVGLCLLVCALLGMSPSFANPVRAAVGELLGLPMPAVLTACIHTHAGPSAIAGSEALGNNVEAGFGGPSLLAGLSPVWQGYLPDPWGDGYEEGVSYGEDFVAGVRTALLDHDHHHDHA